MSLDPTAPVNNIRQELGSQELSLEVLSIKDAFRAAPRKWQGLRPTYFFKDKTHLLGYLASITSDPEALRVVQANNHAREGDNYLTSQKEEGSSPWSGTRNWAEAMNLFRNPDKEVVKQILDLAKKEMVRVRASNPDMVGGHGVTFDLKGDFIDVGTFVEGDPECFGKVDQSGYKYKTVTIVTTMKGASWTVDEEDMSHALAKIVAVVYLLESVGYRVNLYHMDASNTIVATFQVKAAGEPFSIERFVSYYTTHFFRRICFLLIENSTCQTAGYGNSDWDVEVEAPISIFGSIKPIVLHLEEALRSRTTPATIIERVHEAVRANK